jgi:hypothetical protein
MTETTRPADRARHLDTIIVGAGVLLAVLGGIVIMNRNDEPGGLPEFPDATVSPPVSPPESPPVSPPVTPTTQPPRAGEVEEIASNFDTSVHLRSPDWGWGTGYPAFRKFCTFSHVAYVDPILAYGDDEFTHLHTFFGNTIVTSTSDYASLRQTGGGTCQGGPINRTGYWVPSVFDSQGQVVIPNRIDHPECSHPCSGFELYYKAEIAMGEHPDGVDAIVDYPPGLRLVAGQSMGHTEWWWHCVERGGGYKHFPPDCEPGDHLRGTIRFPYCWDGVHLWLPGNAHVRFGSTHAWSRCQGSHPVHLPELTLFYDFSIPPGENPAEWYLSSDRASTDPAQWAANGSTLHADWLMAWDPEVMRSWIQHCLRLMREAGGGPLCEGDESQTTGRQLDWPPVLGSQRRLDGYTPMHPCHYDDTCTHGGVGSHRLDH